jgi:hypothetical protein
MRRLVLVLGVAAWALPALASATETQTYTYDALGRLTKVVHAGTVNDGVKAKYFYDDADNRTEVNVTGTGVSPPHARPERNSAPKPKTKH